MLTEHRDPFTGSLWLTADVHVDGDTLSLSTANSWLDNRWSTHQHTMVAMLALLAASLETTED